MDKRQFLTGVAGGLLSAASLNAQAAIKGSTRSTQAKMPVVLTVSGAIRHTNRGSIDDVRDQMMHKQHVEFTQAFEFDFASLAELPATVIMPTLEYDAKHHILSGPLLKTVLEAADAVLDDKTKIQFRTVDGYNVRPDWTEIYMRRFILATHLDNAPMFIGGLGPLWAVYDADAFSDNADRPLNERFTLCPWGIYQIEVVNDV